MTEERWLICAPELARLGLMPPRPESNDCGGECEGMARERVWSRLMVVGVLVGWCCLDRYRSAFRGDCSCRTGDESIRSTCPACAILRDWRLAISISCRICRCWLCVCLSFSMARNSSYSAACCSLIRADIASTD